MALNGSEKVYLSIGGVPVSMDDIKAFIGSGSIVPQVNPGAAPDPLTPAYVQSVVNALVAAGVFLAA